MAKKKPTPAPVNWDTPTINDLGRVFDSGLNPIYHDPEIPAFTDYSLKPSKYEGLIGDLPGGGGFITSEPDRWDDMAFENQTAGARWAKMVPRIVGSGALKLLQGATMLGGAITAGTLKAVKEAHLAEMRARGEDTSTIEQQGIDSVLEAATDNTLVNTLFKAEEALKDSDLLRVHKPSDWDDRTIWEQLGSMAFWADEFSDGVAFAGQAWLSGGAAGAWAKSVGLGGRTARAAVSGSRSASIIDDVVARAAGEGAKRGGMSSFNDATQAWLSGIGKGIKTNAAPFATQLAVMSTQEAMFEARDTGHQVQASILEELGYSEQAGWDPESQKDFIESLPEEEKQIVKERKGQAMQNTFLANLAALSVSNAVEIGALSRLFGRAVKTTKPGGIQFGDTPLDKIAAIERRGVQKFIGKGSRGRAILGAFASQSAAEGLFEENIQNSIQNISTQFQGLGMVDYLKEVGLDMANNTLTGDKDAWKGIVTGALIGGPMGAASGYVQNKRDTKATNDFVSKINGLVDNVVKLGDIYTTNPDGTTTVDVEKLGQYIANDEALQDITSLHDLYKEAGNEEVANILWNEAVTKLSLSYLEAGFGDQLLKKAKSQSQRTEQELNEEGQETEELDSRGNEVPFQSRVAKYQEAVARIKEDYDSITKRIPDVQENSLRINTAVKTASRIRAIDQEIARNTAKVAELKSKVGGNPILTEYNSQVRELKNLREELRELKKTSPDAAEELKQDIDRKADNLKTFRELNKESVKEQTGTLLPNAEVEAVDTTVNMPSKIELERTEKILAELNAARRAQVQEYKEWTEMSKEKLDEKIKEHFEKVAKEAERDQEIEDTRTSLNSGDVVGYSDPATGAPTAGVIEVDERGVRRVNGIEITKQFLSNNPNFRKMTEEEIEAYSEQAKYNFRVGQLRNRISEIQSNIAHLEGEQKKALDHLKSLEGNLQDIQAKRATQRDRVSQKIWDNRIRAAERAIAATEETIARYDSLISNRRERISEIEQDILERNVETDIASLKEEVLLMKEEYIRVEIARGEQQKLLDKLREYLDFLKSYWRKFFPNVKRVEAAAQEAISSRTRNRLQFQTRRGEARDRALAPYQEAIDRGQEYSNFKQDVEATKEQLDAQESIVRELERQSDLLQAQLELASKEVRQYRSFLNRLLVPPNLIPEAGQEFSSDNPPTNNGAFTSRSNREDGFRGIKDILYGLFTTTGYAGSSQPSQQRWFKWIESLDTRSGLNMLRTVTINDPVYGVGKEQDIFKEDDAAYKTKDNIKVLVVSHMDAGVPVPLRLNGELVYTSLIEITPDKTKLSDFKLSDGGAMFTNKSGLTEDQISATIESYRQFTDRIKNSATPLTIQIRGKSNGHIVTGDPIPAETAFGFIPDKLEVTTKSTINANGEVLDVDLGTAYVYYKGRPIPGTSRKINAAEAKRVLEGLKKYAKERGSVSAATIIKKLKSILYLGKSSNPAFSTYFVKNEDLFTFGSNTITTEELAEGLYDEVILDHLTSLNHQVDLATLNENQAYTSVLGERFTSYREYLLGSEGRENLEVPITFRIVPPSESVNERQIDGMYLRFGDFKSNPVRKAPPAVVKPESKEEQPEVLPFTTEQSTVERPSSSKDELAAERAAEMAAILAEESRELEESQPEVLPYTTEDSTSPTQVIELEDGNTYTVNTDLGTIINNKTGTAISGTSPVGTRVLNKINWEEGTQTVDPLSAILERKDLDVEDEFGDAVMEDSPTELPEPQVLNDSLDDDPYGLGLTRPSQAEIDAERRSSSPLSEKDGERRSEQDSRKEEDDDAPFLLASRVKDYKQANVQKELKELSRILGPNAPVEVVHQLINDKAFGRTLENGKILLYNLMTEGTGYHEAFHVVFSGILTPEARKQLVEEWRAKHPNRFILPDKYISGYTATNNSRKNSGRSILSPKEYIDSLLASSRDTVASLNESISQYKLSLETTKSNLERYEQRVEELRNTLERALAEGQTELADRTRATLEEYQELFGVDSGLDRIGELNKSISDTESLIAEQEIQVVELEAVNTSDVSDFQIEEELAEEFRDYMLSGVLPPSTWIGRVFRTVRNIVRRLLGIPLSQRDQLFHKISTGGFRGRNPEFKIVGGRYMAPKGGFSIIRDLYGISTERDIFNGMTYFFVNELFRGGFNTQDIRKFNNGELNESEKGRISGLGKTTFDAVIQRMYKSHPNNEKVMGLLRTMARNEQQILKNFYDHLKRYNISLNEENTVPQLEETERSKDTLGIIDAIEFNTKSGMPNSIKMLISSLPAMSFKDGKPVMNLNSLGLPTLSDYKRNIAVLHNELSGNNSLSAMRDKIVEIGGRYPEFISKLLPKLGMGTTGPVTPTGLPLQTVRLQNEFRQQFDKYYYDFYIQRYEGDNSYLINANDDRLTDLIKAKWGNSTVRLSSDKVKVHEGRYIFDSAYFSKNYDGQMGDPVKVLQFFKDIGVVFSRPSKINVDNLRSPASNILNAIKADKVGNLFDSGISGWMNDVIAEEVKTSVDFSDNQHINFEGKTVYSISLNNYLTIAARMFNSGTMDYNKWDPKTNTGNPLMRNSHWNNLKKLGYKLKIDILEGAVISGEEREGKSTSDLNYVEASVQQFTSVMQGIFPFIRAGDKKLEHTISMTNKNGSSVTMEGMGVTTIDEAAEVFRGYLADEMLSAWMLNVDNRGKDLTQYNSVGKGLRLFRGVLTAPNQAKADQLMVKKMTRSQAINEIDTFASSVMDNLQSYLEGKGKKVLQDWIDTGILQRTGDTLTNKALPQEILNKYGIEKSSTTKTMQSLAELFAINYLVGNIEQSKLFIGDFAFYKDLFKRTGGLTGTGLTTRTDEEYNTYMNQVAPREDGKAYDNKIKTWVFNDVKGTLDILNKETTGYIQTLVEVFKVPYKKAVDLLSPYKDYDEADAQGYVSLSGYKELLERVGRWTDNHEAVYQKAINGTPLSPAELFTFPPLKPQYFGPQEYEELYVPTFYKFSLMPLIPSMLPKGSALEALSNDMRSNQIDIATFASANKVGRKLSPDFYGADGRYNSGGKPLQILDYNFMKIQLEMSPERHEKVTFGTQFRKLVLSNLAAVGKKIRGRDGREVISEYNGLINKQTDLLVEKLLKDMNIKRVGDKYDLSGSREYLTRLLRDEAFRRNAPDNVIQGILEVIPSGKGLETLITRGKLENILMALFNNNVIRNKVFGDMFVQGASTGFEIKAKKQKDNAWAAQQEELRFYEYTPQGTLAMEVYLPHRFKQLYGKEVNINELDPRLLELIGFRIPTQGLNSIEVIKIKGFLPQEAGNLVIVPSAIVAKSGSDFDIDKLTIFLPNYTFKKDWKKIKKEFGDRHPELKTYLKNRGVGTFNTVIEIAEQPNGTELLDQQEMEVYNAYREIMASSESFGNIEYVEYDPANPTLEGIQNEIIRLSRDIVSAPENFKDLITPISAQVLKDQANIINKLRPDNLESLGIENFIDPDYIMRTREAYLTGKDGVAIAANNLVHHVMSQVAELKISDPNFVINLEHNRLDGNKVNMFGETDAEGNNSILDIISAFLNGYVDIAKDPFLKTINAAVDTANTYFLLIRAGVPLRQAVAFMNQPIIMEYLHKVRLSRSMAKSAIDEIEYRSDIQKALEQKYASPEEFDMSDPAQREEYLKHLKTENLLNFIKEENQEGPTYNAVQKQVLFDFLSYEAASRELGDLVRATNPDTKGTGPTMYTAKEFLARYEEVKNKGFFENVDKLMNDTFLGSYLRAIQTALDVYSPLYPVLESEGAKTVLGEIEEIIGASKEVTRKQKRDDVEKAMQVAKNDLVSYIIQNSSPEGRPFTGKMKKLFHGPGSLPREIAKIKDQGGVLSRNLLIKELYPLFSDKVGEDNFDNIKFFSKIMPTEVANDIIYAWQELWEVKPILAEKLFRFGIMQSSLNNSPIEFLKYAPESKASTLIAEWMTNFSNSGKDYGQFVDRLLRNNWRNGNFVPYVRNYSRWFDERSGRYITRSLIEGNQLSGPKNAINSPFVKTYNRNTTEFTLWKSTGRLNKDGYPLFTKTYKLGDGYNFKEYATDVSMMLSNRVEDTPIGFIQDPQSNRDQLRNEIISSELSQEEKNKYLQRLALATTIEQEAAIVEEMCNKLGKKR
jgi:hypothetical protein